MKNHCYTTICKCIYHHSIGYLLFCCSNLYHFKYLLEKNKIIRGGSYKFNIILCFGAILAFCFSITYNNYYETNDDVTSIFGLDVMCNLRLWLATIAFTLTFMPLFTKTYRISRIFRKIMKKHTVGERKLLVAVLCAVFLDIILLTVMIIISPLSEEQHMQTLKLSMQ